MSPRSRGVRLPLPRPVAPPLPLPTRRRTPPPLITPRHLVREDLLLRNMLRHSRWFKSHQGALQLSRMRRNRRQWAVEVFDEDRLLRVVAEQYQVPVERVPARRVWRSSKGRKLFSVGAAALLCHVSRKTIYNRLSLYRAEFPPRYRRGKDHPRRLRTLTDHEVERLQAL